MEKVKISDDTLSMLETALWSTQACLEEENSDDNLDKYFAIFEIPMEFQVECQEYLNDFIDRARALFTDEELESSPIGHDFWLTLHGHGAGFWDGDYENGDAITEIVRQIRKEKGELEDELRDVLYPVWEEQQKESEE